jgi:hypothetical protein
MPRVRPKVSTVQLPTAEIEPSLTKDSPRQSEAHDQIMETSSLAELKALPPAHQAEFLATALGGYESVRGGRGRQVLHVKYEANLKEKTVSTGAIDYQKNFEKSRAELLEPVKTAILNVTAAIVARVPKAELTYVMAEAMVIADPANVEHWGFKLVTSFQPAKGRLFIVVNYLDGDGKLLPKNA